MDHTNYSRWLPEGLQIRDMMTLNHVHPNVFVQFCAGNFVVRKKCKLGRKTKCKLGQDQAHEQSNALVNRKGRAENGKLVCILTLNAGWTRGCTLAFKVKSPTNSKNFRIPC